MTNGQALHILKNRQMCERNCKPGMDCDGCSYDYNEKLIPEAIDMAIEAMERLEKLNDDRK